MDEENAIITIDVVSSLPAGSHVISSTVSDVTIYPNPVSEKLFITSSSKQIEIKDLLGRTIYQQSVTEKQTVIDVSRLPSGVYFTLLKDENGNELVRKFIKQ